MTLSPSANASVFDFATVPTASIPGTNGYEAATPFTQVAQRASLKFKEE